MDPEGNLRLLMLIGEGALAPEKRGSAVFETQDSKAIEAARALFIPGEEFAVVVKLGPELYTISGGLRTYVGMIDKIRGLISRSPVRSDPRAGTESSSQGGDGSRADD